MFRTLTPVAIIAITITCHRPRFVDLSAQFPRLNNQQADLTHAFRLEQVTSPYLVINFFAPNCPPCITELPELKKFQETTSHNNQVTFVAIGSTLEALAQSESVNHEQAAVIVAPFVKQHHLPYPIYLADTSTLQNWNITGFPETFIFSRNRQGNWQLKRKFISAVTAAQLQAALDEPDSSLY